MPLTALCTWSLRQPTTASNLTQEYVLVPRQVRPCYLLHVLQRLGPWNPEGAGDGANDGEGGGAAGGKPKKAAAHKDKRKKRRDAEAAALVAGDGAVVTADAVVKAASAIVFVSTIHSAQFLTELLTEMGVLCTGLHSAMSQKRRIASLGKFKSAIVPVRHPSLSTSSAVHGRTLCCVSTRPDSCDVASCRRF